MPSCNKNDTILHSTRILSFLQGAAAKKIASYSFSKLV
ncbi:hypothetical protein CHCC20335_0726 [Bacillus paralicheniformis]|nr:hypothetical protein CHCC20335_0726 [Bacillus paralicheniformis]